MQLLVFARIRHHLAAKGMNLIGSCVYGKFYRHLQSPSELRTVQLLNPMDAQEGIEPSSSGYEPDMLPLQTPRRIEVIISFTFLRSHTITLDSFAT